MSKKRGRKQVIAEKLTQQIEMPFSKRTVEGWNSFLSGEADLRHMIDEKQESEQIIARCSELLTTAFSDISFELGYNGEKYELILTPEGDMAKLFQLVYFQKHVPAELSENWNVLVGRQPSNPDTFTLQMFGQSISAEDILVSTKLENNDTVKLHLYCKKLLPLLKENEDNAYWLMSVMLDQIVGEIAAMRYISGLELLEAPMAENSFLLDQLPGNLSKMFAEADGDIFDAANYCERYTAYEMNPNQDIEADLRQDVFVGITSLVPLINQYLRNDNTIMDNFHNDGITAGFFYYPLDSFAGENRGAQILDFRENIMDEISAQAGADAVTFIGGASGIYYGYLDFIAWDLKTALNTAVKIFNEKNVPWAAFHAFRHDADDIILKDTGN